MKLVYLANARFPTEKAHGLQIVQMCDAFAQNGHEVTLIVPRRKNNSFVSPWEYYGLKKSFKIVYVPVIDFIPWDRWLGNSALWLTTLWFAFNARQVVEDASPDLVYSRDAFLERVAPEGIPFIFEAHDFPSKPWLYRCIWKSCTRIITVTDGLKNAFLAAHIPEDKVKTAHDAVDLEKFRISGGRAEVRRTLGLSTEGLIAIYTGHLYPYKGADDLLEACAHLRTATKIVFVGGLPDDIARLHARSTELGIGNAFFIGPVTHVLIPIYLRAADVAVLPTRSSDRHSAEFLSPLKLFEYMAAGKAIVATDLPSVREILDDRMAEFVPPGDPIALAAALDTLSAEPLRREKMEQASIAEAASHSWRSRAESVLVGVLGMHPPPSWCRRHRLAFFFAMLSLLLRSIYVVFFPQAPISGGDAPLYLSIADVLRGALQGIDIPAFYQPLYPMVLAVIRTFFGSSLVWIRLFQAAASASTVFLMTTMAQQWSSRRTAMIAGLLGTLSVPMILESGIIYTETLYTLFVTASIALVLMYLRQPTKRRALETGAVLALAGLTREIGFYLGVTLTGLLAVIRRPRLLAVIILLPILLAMGSIIIRNIGLRTQVVPSRPPLLSKGYEATLIDPASRPYLLRWKIYPLGLWRFFRYPGRLTDLSDDTSTKRVLLSGDVRRIIPEAPLILAKLMLVLMHWLILSAAVYGLWRGRLDRRAKIVFSTAIVFAAATIIISGAARLQGFEYLEPLARYRFPVEPLIMILAAVGIDRLSKKSTKKSVLTPGIGDSTL